MLVRWIAGILGVVFAWALIGKARDLTSFTNYLRPIARTKATAVARGALAVEGLLAIGLAVTVVVPAVGRLVGLLLSGFVLLATATYAGLLAKGDRTRCHCFGSRSTTTRAVEWQAPVLGARNWALLSLGMALVPGLGAQGVFVSGMICMGTLAAGLLAAWWRERRWLALEDHPRVVIYAPQMKHLQAHTWWLNGRPRPL